MNTKWQDAATRGDARSLRAQIDEGADVDALDRYGQSALMLAGVRGHLDAVRVLVRAGAELDTTAKFGLSAMMLAILNDHVEVAELLADAGADPGIRGTGAPGFSDSTAADLARERGHLSLADRLEEER